jgi:hypothetical protein
MGSMISLGVGRLEIDWGKNDVFRNHSKLFLPGDNKEATYYYANGVTYKQPAYLRKLSSVKNRLDLLGYSIEHCRQSYEQNKPITMIHDNEEEVIPFDLFSKIITSIDINKIPLAKEDSDYFDYGEYVVRCIFNNSEFKNKHPNLGNMSINAGKIYENLDPYITLRLLAENQTNLPKQVVWGYADVVEGGWVSEDQIYEGLDVSDCYTIVTEGSSDTNILKKSLELFSADTFDFFNFIDMSENYPFTGVGNIYRFCQGMIKIGIQNKIIILLDNDTAGLEIYNKIILLDMPYNIKVLLLPNLDDCCKIETIGPSGKSIEDINGRALSIEFFLDLQHNKGSKPAVRWKTYNEALRQYQGELINKDDYTKSFLKLNSFRKYNTSKLRYLCNYVTESCSRVPLITGPYRRY